MWYVKVFFSILTCIGGYCLWKGSDNIVQTKKGIRNIIQQIDEATNSSASPAKPK